MGPSDEDLLLWYAALVSGTLTSAKNYLGWSIAKTKNEILLRMGGSNDQGIAVQ